MRATHSWDDFKEKDLAVDCPFCGAETTPSEVCLRELPYLVFYHVCESCKAEFEAVYELVRVE